MLGPSPIFRCLFFSWLQQLQIFLSCMLLFKEFASRHIPGSVEHWWHKLLENCAGFCPVLLNALSPLLGVLEANGIRDTL
jgi:hypothetical protein